MTEGFFKMQISSFLHVIAINTDPTISTESVPDIVKHISSRVALKPEKDRSPLPHGNLRISTLARWFKDNQMPDASS